MIGIQNMPNIDSTDPTSYPDGCIKDDPSGISGTPIEKDTVNDMYMFFDKFNRVMGITPNNSLDNEVNGYQTLQAVVTAMAANAGPVFQQFLGANYDATKVYVLSGAATRSNNGIIFYNGKIYFLLGNTGPVCGGGTVDVISQKLVNGVPEVVNGLLAAKVVCATASSGWSDFSAVVRTFYPGLQQSWTNATVTGTGWASYTPLQTAKYRKNDQGQVFLQGAIISTTATPGTDVYTLPIGYRPAMETLFPVMGYDGSTYIQNYIRIRTNGIVQVLSVVSITGAGWWFDLGSVTFLNS